MMSQKPSHQSFERWNRRLRFRGENSSGLGQIRLIRRSGQVVPWNSAKIEVAVRKAFLSLRLDSAPAVEISRNVTQRAIATGQAFINIEDVQDIVQEELMRKGFFKVASNHTSSIVQGDV